MTAPTVTAGSRVSYTLTPDDVTNINSEWPVPPFGQPKRATVNAGDVLAADVSKVDPIGGTVNLRVLLDGEQTYWARNIAYGPGLGQWQALAS